MAGKRKDMALQVQQKEVRLSRWYFGGVAACGAVCITHPLDLLKVQLQTQTKKGSLIEITSNIVKHQGVLALYNGISAAIGRQLTYSMARFGIYEVAKQSLEQGETSFFAKVGMAGFAGAAGGFIGTPADMINVRMQNDVKLPMEQRRNYKHVIDGAIRVVKEEGFSQLFRGANLAIVRAILMTIGQISFYDQSKELLMKYAGFEDNMKTHMLSSIIAGGCATTLTQPVDVLKTRAMNAKHGEFKSTMHLIKFTASEGPQAFFKGYIPAFVRLAPQTILTFVFLEQLRLNFGYIVPPKE